MSSKNITYKPNVQKAYILIGFFSVIFFGNLQAQDQKKSDSLIAIYKRGVYDKNDELELLRQIAEDETNTDEILSYSLQLIVAAKTAESPVYEFDGYLQKGNAYRLKSDLSKALESYFDAANVAEESNLSNEKAKVNGAIADV